MKSKHFCVGVIIAAIMLLPCGSAWAAFGEDVEKPKPEFTQTGNDWVVKLIPRAKSNPIQIRFHVTGGTLTAVGPKEFTAGDMPMVDLKTFRSDFFSFQIASGTPGGEVTLSLSSDYFTTATEFWGPSAKGSTTWINAGAVTSGQKEGESKKTKTLNLTVKDGGPMDADGVADGRIEVIAGPRDSFWGYALGTLCIRFFGVFLVLGVLEIGMIISGSIFQAMGKNGTPAAGQPVEPLLNEPAAEEETPSELPSTVAAAIAIALHLHCQAGPAMSLADSQTGPGSIWAEFGRSQCMADRMSAFDRIQRN
jgi:hypothetical protein